jgi:hypothetical protein
MKAMEDHLEDEMLAGFGALRVVRDEEQDKASQKLVRLPLSCHVWLNPSPRDPHLTRITKAKGKRKIRRKERRTEPRWRTP